MYPTMELLLRHSIGYLHLRGKSVVAEPGILDNEDLLIQNMKPGVLSDEERRVALSIYLLSCIMDGEMGATQMELWERLVSTFVVTQIHPTRLHCGVLRSWLLHSVKKLTILQSSTSTESGGLPPGSEHSNF